MTRRLLTEHPAAMGETYAEHLQFALRFGGSMILGGLACIIHGLLPFCLTTSGSRRVRTLHAILSRPGPRAMPSRNMAADEFNWSI